MTKNHQYWIYPKNCYHFSDEEAVNDEKLKLKTHLYNQLLQRSVSIRFWFQHFSPWCINALYGQKWKRMNTCIKITLLYTKHKVASTVKSETRKSMHSMTSPKKINNLTKQFHC